MLYYYNSCMQQENRERQSQQQEEAQQYDTFLYKFQQQIIDAWKPVPHTSSNVVLYIILSAICIGLGLGLILSAPSSQQIFIRYDNACTVNAANTDNAFASAPCKITFTLKQTLAAPVYMYYGFKGFYQNHRRYLKYFSANQLSSGSPEQGVTQCGDYHRNEKTFGVGALSDDGTTPLVATDIAFPCGTIARYYNKLRKQIRGWKLFNSAGTQILNSQTGIAWPSDIGRHKNADKTKRAFSVQEQSWLVWFRPAARSEFYKLNGIINTDIPAGTYTVTFLNHVNPTWGEKWFHLSKSNFVGNRDLFLGIAFLALGGGCFILLIVFIAKWIAQKRDRQKHE